MKKLKILIIILVSILIIVCGIIIIKKHKQQSDQLFNPIIEQMSDQKKRIMIAKVGEAMALAKSHIIYDYRENSDKTMEKAQLTSDLVKKLIEEYLNDEDLTINVTKDPTGYKFIVSVDGLDLGKNNEIDFTELENYLH